MSMHQAALDNRRRPALFDSAGSSLTAIDDSDKRCWDALQKLFIRVGGFAFAPVPGDDVVDGGGHD